MPSSSNDTIACNRQPFLSDSGCDRSGTGGTGGVDIHQFDDFPFCDTIDPTLSDVPPEIVDTPIDIPIPPSCTCINIEYALSMKYSSRFGANATFKAKGDCCEGEYQTNMNLQIPCPIDGSGNRKIKASVKYGKGESEKEVDYATLDGANCDISLLNPSIDLNIPCPIDGSGSRKIKASIKYGKGESEKEVDYANMAGSCNVSLVDANLDLSIPCPIGGGGTRRMRASIQYGDGPQSQEVNIAEIDSCHIDVQEPEINLNIPCPIKGRGNTPKIIIGLAYSGYSSSSDRYHYQSHSFMEADPEACAINPLSPQFDLHIGCPIKIPEPQPKIKMRMEWKTPQNQDVKSSVSMSFIKKSSSSCALTMESHSYCLGLPCPIDLEKQPPTIKIDWQDKDPQGQPQVKLDLLKKKPGKTCEMEMTDASFHLALPCPVDETGDKKIYGKVSYGIGGRTEAVYANVDRHDCNISLREPTLDLTVPCPVSGTSKLTAGVTYGTGGQKTVTLAENTGDCNLSLNSPSLNLTVPCPIKKASGKIRASVEYGEALSAFDSFAEEDGDCGIRVKDVTLNMSIPCPVSKSNLKITTTAEAGDNFSLEVDEDQDNPSDCNRRIRLKLIYKADEEGSSSGGGSSGGGGGGGGGCNAWGGGDAGGNGWGGGGGGGGNGWSGNDCKKINGWE